MPITCVVAELGGVEAERIFDRVYNPTTAEIAWSHALEREAAERLDVDASLKRAAPQLRPHRRTTAESTAQVVELHSRAIAAAIDDELTVAHRRVREIVGQQAA